MFSDARYNAQGFVVAIVDGYEMTIPDDMDNRHRRMLADWEAGGNTIAPYEPPPSPTPEENRATMPPLTARQLRLGLIGGGFSLSDVEATIDGIPDAQQKAVAEIEWQYAVQFERMHPLIEQVGASLGMTPEQIDALWEQALGL